jgi:murein DD-endopeptidase MepM/ murein hydrolase activator NlpD
MGGRNRRRAAVAVLAAGASLIAGTWTARAQLPPLTPSQEQPPVTLFPPPPDTTPTTEAPPPTEPAPPTDATPPDGESPSTTAGESGGGEDEGSPETTVAAEGEPPADGDGAAAPLGGVVPPEAQRVINSIARTAPGDNDALIQGAAALEAAGMADDDAVSAVFGRFPILGPSRWVDDWYYPRWTGTTFRYHLGLDMMAPYGTPVAAPADGVTRIGSSELGGLTVSVIEADGTLWYLAHLSGIAEGIVTGDAVTLGQVVGYVGDSGNARGGAPHLHFAVHPNGGQPVPPKPIVDRWVADGAARVPELLGSPAVAPRTAAAVATDLTRGLAAGANSADSSAPVGPARSELLWATGANPAGGGVRLAEAAAAAVNEGVDWNQRAAQQRALDEAWSRSSATAAYVLGPLTSAALRQTLETRRAAVRNAAQAAAAAG